MRTLSLWEQIMGIRFEKGQRVVFWFSRGGVRKPRVEGIAMEPGETGIARTYKIMAENSRGEKREMRISGNQIYIVFDLSLSLTKTKETNG